MDSPSTTQLPLSSTADSSGKTLVLEYILEAIRSLQEQAAERREIIELVYLMIKDIEKKNSNSSTAGDLPESVTLPASVESSRGTETDDKSKVDPPKSGNPGYQSRQDRNFSLESRFHLVNQITKKSTYQQAKASIDLFREIVDHYGMTYDDCFDAFRLCASEYESWIVNWRQINGFRVEQFWTMIEGFLLDIERHSPARNPHHLMLSACKQTGTLEEYHEEFDRCHSLTDLDFRNDEYILTNYLHGLKPHLAESLVRTPLTTYKEAYEVLCERKAVDFSSKGRRPKRSNRNGPKKAGSTQSNRNAKGHDRLSSKN